jgi:hypothetical protein
LAGCLFFFRASFLHQFLFSFFLPLQRC